MSSITIGIPTFGRDFELMQVLKRAKDQAILTEFELILIDDKPSEKLGSFIAEEYPSIKFLRHETNMGFARSFVELLRQCPTPYLMLSADDDFLCLSGLTSSEEYLRGNKCDLLSTQWLRDGKVHRGRVAIGPIGYSEVRQATNHAPGLIFNVESAMRHAPLLQELLDCGNYAAQTYPQVVLSYLILFEGGLLKWHNSAPVSEGFAAPSQFTDAAGNSYWSLAGRVQEYFGFAEFFRRCASEVSSPIGRDLALQLSIFHEQ